MQTKTKTKKAADAMLDRAASTTELTDDHLLSERDASGMTGFPMQTLRKWRCGGVGPKHVKLGRIVRYRLGDIREWVRASTRQRSGPNNANTVD